jgi:hypothetical protein
MANPLGRAAGIQLAIAVLFATVPPVAAALPPGGSFIDDNGSTFETAIEAVAAEGITTGKIVDSVIQGNSGDGLEMDAVIDSIDFD